MSGWSNSCLHCCGRSCGCCFVTGGGGLSCGSGCGGPGCGWSCCRCCIMSGGTSSRGGGCCYDGNRRGCSCGIVGRSTWSRGGGRSPCARRRRRCCIMGGGFMSSEGNCTRSCCCCGIVSDSALNWGSGRWNSCGRNHSGCHIATVACVANTDGNRTQLNTCRT